MRASADEIELRSCFCCCCSTESSILHMRISANNLGKNTLSKPCNENKIAESSQYDSCDVSVGSLGSKARGYVAKHFWQLAWLCYKCSPGALLHILFAALLPMFTCFERTATSSSNS